MTSRSRGVERAGQGAPVWRLAAVGAAVLTLTCAVEQTPPAQAASPGPPRCAPSRLNQSSKLPGTTLSVSPLPDSYDASPHTQISLLGATPAAIAGVSVSGSRSGAHSGRLAGYSQGDGASFLPSKAFVPGETVTVRGRERVGRSVAHFAFHFTISEPDVLPSANGKASGKMAGKPGDVQSFHSQPDIHPPSTWVLASSPSQEEPGYVFAAPYSGPGQDGPMIFDSSGKLVWFHPLSPGTEATNFRVQSYGGQPVLTWWQGRIPAQGFGLGEEIIADSSYRTIMQVRAGNGYLADLHDFHLLENGTALLTVFNTIRCNLSYVGGRSLAAVTDGVFQELDLRAGLVRREWHSVDHVALADSYSSPRSSSMGWPFDYFHINTIQTAHDGSSFLVSSRNTSALYLISAATGEITERIGGKHSSVKLNPGAATAYQHDAKELSNGDLSIFDNGGVPMVHKQSRGIIVSINPQSLTDTLVTEFLHPSPLQAGSQGNVELLENGNAFVGWGAAPFFSEFTSTGKLVFDARMPYRSNSYRGYRFQWSGTPAEPPAVAAVAGKHGLTVYASWNGATGVSSWRLLGGKAANSLAPIATAPRSGFETAISTSHVPAYVAVQALGAAGEVLATSHAVKG